MLLKRKLQSCLRLSNQGLTTLVMSKGCGVLGSLGHGNDLLDYSNFKSIDSFSCKEKVPQNTSAISVAAGWGHSAVVDNKGQLYLFGRPFEFSTIFRINRLYKFSSFLARCVSASSSNSSFFGDASGFYPDPVHFPCNDKVTAVSCSAGLTAILTAVGDVYCVGINKWDQCGIPSVLNVLQPTRVLDIPACKMVDTGLQHCIALSIEGDVYTWGKAARGQIGVIGEPKNLPPSLPPSKVSLSGKGSTMKAIQVSAGFTHSAALSVDGAIYVWGKGMSDKYKDKGGALGRTLFVDILFIIICFIYAIIILSL